MDELRKGGVILLAEDNKANVLAIGEYLETHGYTIVYVRDGLDAIQKAEKTNLDIILGYPNASHG